MSQANVLERTWSDLLREPSAVAQDVEQSDVVLRRRDAENLYLVTEQRQAATQEAFRIVSRMLASAASDQAMRQRLQVETAIPWLGFLPDEHRAEFAREFVETAIASAELGSLRPLATLISEWRNTALIHADPRLASALQRFHPGTDETVTPPGAESG
jgi:hypothetical protein